MLPPDTVVHLSVWSSYGLTLLFVAVCCSLGMNVCSEVIMSGTRGITMLYIEGELAQW